MRHTLRILALGLTAGMAVPALAAPAVYDAPVNWTGLYAGVHVGGGWVDENETFKGTNGTALDPVGTKYDTGRSSALGGIGVGYNYQIEQWVVGAEGDFSWTDAKGTSTTNSTKVTGARITTEGQTYWYSSLAARGGYAYDRVLFYGKGGVAFSEQAYGGHATGVGSVYYPTFEDTRVGGLVGAGLEWAVCDKISVLAEYNYLAFGSKDYNITNSTHTVTSKYEGDPSVNVFKVGMNYHF